MTDKPARRWRHKKRGSTYTEIGRGNFQSASHPGLDMEGIVLYRADEDGRLWARMEDEFEDGRFEEIPADG